tara:strand:- start:33 stop:185 length:153 start_codon:yes stop_codon:yes gene_type:complete
MPPAEQLRLAFVAQQQALLEKAAQEVLWNDENQNPNKSDPKANQTVPPAH